MVSMAAITFFLLLILRVSTYVYSKDFGMFFNIVELLSNFSFSVLLFFKTSLARRLFTASEYECLLWRVSIFVRWWLSVSMQ